MAKTASIVYWYAGSELKADGGGLRALAWKRALEELGFETEIAPLRTIGGRVPKGWGVSAVKVAVLPMPFARPLPDTVLDSDLVVATVPAVFGDALKRVPRDRLMLDWMDLWSVYSRNTGDANWLSKPGGRAQSRVWSRRESRWAPQARVNVYAGYSDFEAMSASTASAGVWIPTPVPYRGHSKVSTELRTVGFIGNVNYPPNQISLRAFLDAYAERLHKQGVRTLVAGFGSEQVRDWGFPVDVLGQVADVDDFYSQIDAAVIPVDHGGGIKVKAVEALSFGVPAFGTAHVRAGFSPEFRPFILDASMLLESVLSPAGHSVTQDLFESRFSQEAFNRSVAANVHSL